MFTAEPIAGHERGHWEVVNEGIADLPWCETANERRARDIAAALNHWFGQPQSLRSSQEPTGEGR